jgi:hypothetical protein
MSKKNFHLEIKVKATPEETIRRINQVDKWWAKNVKGKSVKEKDKFTVDFGETFVDFQITELVPNRRIVWKITDCNLHWIKNHKEWKGSEVIFELTPAQTSTKIDFTHSGMIPKWECYEDCEAGWTDHVGRSLVNFINKGKGSPV